MSNLVIMGAQWGDEGKLHLIPSGILYEGKKCIIGNGLVVNPKSLINEINYLKEKGVSVKNLVVSDRAHLILPYHIEIDRLEESARGENSIGTTVKGIGPCYRDKVERCGLRMCDFSNREKFEEKLRYNVKRKNDLIVKYYEGQPLDEDEIVKEYIEYMKEIEKYIADTNVIMREALKNNSNILFEGAQGTFLDIDYGTYPYVTSSHPISGGISVGAGISANKLQSALGVVKAYTTRVGKGPFPTELFDETGDEIREKGFEYGTTTGRPRRCGWLDMVMLNYSVEINGLTSIVLTKLDTLSDFEKLMVCVEYELKGKKIDFFPANLDVLAECEPVYIEMNGWKMEEIDNAESYDDLPENAKKYVEMIERITGVPVDIVSVGPGRNQTFVRKEIF